MPPRPAGRFDVAAAVEAGPADLRRRGERRPARPAASGRQSFDHVVPERSGCRRTRCTGRRTSWPPTSGRPSRSPSGGAGSSAAPSWARPRPRSPWRRRRRSRQRMIARRPGRPVRSRRARAAGLQRDHERRAGPGRRGRARSPSVRPRSAEFGGLPHPAILGLCALLGVEEVYAVGGAQAIAMFAYGVPDLCEPVNLITGPGQHLRHRRQAAAQGPGQHRLRGRPDRDRHPGRRHRPTRPSSPPTSSPRPNTDPSSAAVLITADADLADRTQIELKAQVPWRGTASGSSRR